MFVLVDKRNMESSSDTTNSFNSGAVPVQVHTTPSKGLYQTCPLVSEIASFAPSVYILLSNCKFHNRFALSGKKADFKTSWLFICNGVLMA
jgi:hypothetical protein